MTSRSRLTTIAGSTRRTMPGRAAVILTSAVAMGAALSACSSTTEAQTSAATPAASASASTIRQAGKPSYYYLDPARRLCVTNKTGHATIGYTWVEGVKSDDLVSNVPGSGELPKGETMCVSADNSAVPVMAINLQIPGVKGHAMLTVGLNPANGTTDAGLGGASRVALQMGSVHYLEDGEYRLDVAYTGDTELTNPAYYVQNFSATLY